MNSGISTNLRELSEHCAEGRNNELDISILKRDNYI